jgi:hypothetical protein
MGGKIKVDRYLGQLEPGLTGKTSRCCSVALMRGVLWKATIYAYSILMGEIVLLARIYHQNDMFEIQ